MAAGYWLKRCIVSATRGQFAGQFSQQPAASSDQPAAGSFLFLVRLCLLLAAGSFPLSFACCS
jgi:hypothetical protein